MEWPRFDAIVIYMSIYILKAHSVKIDEWKVEWFNTNEFVNRSLMHEHGAYILFKFLFLENAKLYINNLKCDSVCAFSRWNNKNVIIV